MNIPVNEETALLGALLGFAAFIAVMWLVGVALKGLAGMVG